MEYLAISEIVNSLQSSLKILDVISKKVTLRQDGEIFYGQCPFHEDAGESLMVNPAAGIFYCSGCHANGGVLKFIALSENITLLDALDRQIDNFGFKVPRRNVNEENIKRKQRELEEINDYARDFYHDILTDTDEGEVCRKYLKSRGITNDAIRKFQLGFAPSVERNLAVFLRDYDFKFGLMFETGLVNRVENSIVDALHECVTIPLLNESGHTTALVGQVVDFEKKIFYETDGVSEKYVYPAETAIFNKNQQLFGFQEARISIIKSKVALVVEGCLDAITLKCAGIENVVATFEKNFTSEHADTLSTYAEEIVFCVKNGAALQLDEDAIRTAAIKDKKIFVAAFTKNPAELVIEDGKESFHAQLKNRVPFDEYKFAEKIHSTIELQRQYALPTPPEPEPEPYITPAVIRAEEAILKLIWLEAKLLKYTLAILPKNSFTAFHQEVIEYLQICAEENKRPSIRSFRIFFGDESIDDFVDVLLDENCSLEQDTQAFEDAVDFLLKRYRKFRYSKGKITVAKDNAKSTEKIKRLLEFFEQYD